MQRVLWTLLGVAGGVVCTSTSAARADDPGHTKPPLTAPAYVAGLPGKVAAQTAVGHNPSAPADPVLRLFDLSGGPPYPAGYITSPTQRYSDPGWTRQKLGTIFGLTIDRGGNMYVGHTNVYTGNGFQQVGSVLLPLALPNTRGTVYRINGVSGGATKLTNLPQVGGGGGVGNIDYDVQFNQFFATNFTDDRVYRISQAGAILSTFKHSTGAVSLGGAPDPTALTPYAPVGRRLWGVGKLNDRVYYGIWNTDFLANTGVANTVWSVGIGPGGDFVPRSRRLEVTVPLWPTSPAAAGPIADLSFSADCRMLIAERSMFGDTYTGAHNARALEYNMSGGVWVLSAANTNAGGAAMGLPVGNYGSQNNSAGGCDYDFEVRGPVGGRRGIYVTADAQLLSSPPGLSVYGFEGIDRAGAPPSGNGNSCYDYDATLTTSDKMHQGDVELSSPVSCGRVITESIKCFGETTPATYQYSLQIINGTPQTIATVGLSVIGGTVSPPTVMLGTPVPPGGTVTIAGVILSGVTGPGPVCVIVSLGNGPQEVFCTLSRCISLPRCDCLSVERLSTGCNGTTPVGTLLIRNRRAALMTAVQLVPLSPGVVFTPSVFAQPAVPFFGLSTAMNFSISGAVAGQQVCFRVRNLSGEDVCETVACLVVPRCRIVVQCIPCVTAVAMTHRVSPTMLSDGRFRLEFTGFAPPAPQGVDAYLLTGAFQVGGGEPQAFEHVFSAGPGQGEPARLSLVLGALSTSATDAEVAFNYTITELDATGTEVGVREPISGGGSTNASRAVSFGEGGFSSTMLAVSGGAAEPRLTIRTADTRFSGLLQLRFIPSPGVSFDGGDTDGSLRRRCVFADGVCVVPLPITFERIQIGDAVPVQVAVEDAAGGELFPVNELVVVQVGSTCLADVAGGGPDGTLPDGNVDGSDFIAFINSFAIGDASVDATADVAGQGANGLEPDGTIDGTDFIAFINAFAAGC